MAAALQGFPASEFTIDKPYQLWASAHLLGSLPLLELPLPSRVRGFPLCMTFGFLWFTDEFLFITQVRRRGRRAQPHLILTWRGEERVPPILAGRHPPQDGLALALPPPGKARPLIFLRPPQVSSLALSVYGQTFLTWFKEDFSSCPWMACRYCL